MQSKPFEWNLPEATPAGERGATEIFAAPTQRPPPTSPPVTWTDEPLGGRLRESIEDPVLHR